MSPTTTCSQTGEDTLPAEDLPVPSAAIASSSKPVPIMLGPKTNRPVLDSLLETSVEEAACASCCMRHDQHTTRTIHIYTVTISNTIKARQHEAAIHDPLRKTITRQSIHT